MMLLDKGFEAVDTMTIFLVKHTLLSSEADCIFCGSCIGLGGKMVVKGAESPESIRLWVACW